MRRLPARLFVLLLTTLLTAGAVWRVTTNEQTRGRARMASQHADATAAEATWLLADLRASLHAYVAPGQSESFWSARAADLLDNVRARLLEIDPASTAAGYSLATALDGVDRLAASARRAQDYARTGQPLAAGDIIFVEARDLIDAMTRELSSARQSMARATSAREAGMTNEQSLLAGAVMAVWIVALILLVPVPRAAGPPPTTPVTTLSLADVKAPESPPVPAAVVNPATTPAAAVAESSGLAAAVTAEGPAPAPPVVVAAPQAPGPTPVLRDLASLCGDLGRVSEAGDLEPLLARATTLLGAKGLVVWLLTDQTQGLAPAFAYGYDPVVMARMGAVALSADNLTASAFRSGVPATSPATSDRAAAVAVPIVTANGPAGVLAAEVRPEADIDQSVALAAVVAAQMANLFPAPEPLAERAAT
ncbi:MAG: hypothetical protein IT177_22620 [Acidobacteria bacterium]|nr:hypothetical protein [Acidobacteriota bacterium]